MSNHQSLNDMVFFLYTKIEENMSEIGCGIWKQTRLLKHNYLEFYHNWVTLSQPLPSYFHSLLLYFLSLAPSNPMQHYHHHQSLSLFCLKQNLISTLAMTMRMHAQFNALIRRLDSADSKYPLMSYAIDFHRPLHTHNKNKDKYTYFVQKKKIVHPFHSKICV